MQHISQQSQHSLQCVLLAGRGSCEVVGEHLGVLMASISLLDLYPPCSDDSPLHLHMVLDPGNRRYSHLSVVVYVTDIKHPSISLSERNECGTCSGIRRIKEVLL